MSAITLTEPTAGSPTDLIQRLAISLKKDSVTPIAALEQLLLPQISAEQRSANLKILGNTVEHKNTAKQIDIYTMHKNLANKYQEASRKNETDQDVLDGLLNDQEKKGTQAFLAYLFAPGLGGSTILHVILDPNTYEGIVFQLDAVKPLISFLLRLYPDLPSTLNKDRQPPIYMSLQATGVDSFLPEVKEGVIRFLCEEQNEGLGSKAAINSLAQIVSNNSSPFDSCHAIHKIIECADFEISEALVEKLSEVMTSGELHSQTKTCCFETRDGMGRTCLHIAITAPLSMKRIWWAERLAELHPDLLKALSTIKGKDGKEQQLTPLQHFTKQKTEMVDKCKEKGDLKLIHEMERLEAYLKRQCLAKFDNSTCMSVMFNKGNAKQIFLTLDDDIVSWEFLESQKLHYKLDTSLKRVHIFNSVSIHWDEQSLEARKIAKSWKCAGNFDLFMIFFWLKNEVQVKKILEVVVDDGAGQEESTSDISEMEKKPHSDQAIIECLKGLGIETLKWKRIDLPAEVIIEGAGKDVKHLYLYCSGSQAVLQSWADSNGLSKLENLAYVYIVIDQGLESYHWANEHAKKFQKDLKETFEKLNPMKNAPVVDYRIIRPKKALGAKSAESEIKNQDEQGFEEQDWLKCMDEFADIMEVVEQQPDSLSIGIQKSTHPIRVALIDDGVKTSYAGLDNNIYTGKSGWQRSDSQSTQTRNTQWEHFRSYNSSHTGHGTVMAYYIKRVCPRVSLYVAKLDCKPHRGSASGYSANVTFSIDSVAQAIEWAVEQEVDIISMSWAIEKGNTPSHTLLWQAVHKAVEKNIILFCANPDRGTGYIENDTYPYSLDHTHIICVGAATQSGVRWNQIDAKDESCKYFLPGVELGIQVETKQRRNPDGPPREWRTHSGSSLSCALAAGLAAMILHCSLVTGVATFGSPKWKWLRSHEGICSAFEKIQVDRKASGWLPVRHFFKSVVHNENVDNAKKAQAIKGLIEDIFQGMPSRAAQTHS